MTKCKNLLKYISVEFIYSSIAQLVEHAAVNRRVVGSSPTGGANTKRHPKGCLFVLYSLNESNQRACEPLADARNRATTAACGGSRECGGLCSNTANQTDEIGADEVMLQTDVVRVQLEEPTQKAPKRVLFVVYSLLGFSTLHTSQVRCLKYSLRYFPQTKTSYLRLQLPSEQQEI